MTGTRAKRIVSKILWKLFSVPIYFKILGIGAFVAALFGIIVSFQIQMSSAQGLYENLEERAVLSARLLSFSLARPLVVDDEFTINEVLQEATTNFSEIAYIAVHDDCGDLVAHSFPGRIPASLMHQLNRQANKISVFQTDDDLLLEATAPILDGEVGYVRVGVSERHVVSALKKITTSFVWTLIFCVICGQVLALVVTYVLTKPIHHLVKVSTKLRSGDLSARSTVFSNDEIGLLAQSFNSMAAAIEKSNRALTVKEKARLQLIRKVVAAQEEERQRISHELHDETGQTLSFLMLQLKSLSFENEANRAAQQEIQASLMDLFGQVKEMSFALRPAVLDDYGIDSALERYVADLQKRVDFQIDYQSISSPDVPSLKKSVEVTLYRITQEAVTNIVRHAQASSVGIVLMVSRTFVSLIIEDDGVGFDKKDVQGRGHPSLGLIGMEERATLLDGDVIVESIVGRGTTVRVRIPLAGGKE